MCIRKNITSRVEAKQYLTTLVHYATVPNITHQCRNSHTRSIIGQPTTAATTANNNGNNSQY